MINHGQYEMLTLIDDHTAWEGNDRPGATISGYFVPARRSNFSKTLKKEMFVNGPGDAATIKFLFRKGLALSIPKLNPYACAITEKGMIALEEYREKFVYVDGHFPPVSDGFTDQRDEDEADQEYCDRAAGRV